MGRGRDRGQGAGGKSSGRQLELVERAMADRRREGKELVGGNSRGEGGSLATSRTQ